MIHPDNPKACPVCDGGGRTGSKARTCFACLGFGTVPSVEDVLLDLGENYRLVDAFSLDHLCELDALVAVGDTIAYGSRLA